MSKKSELNSCDHRNMDTFLGHMLDDYKAGVITREDAVSSLAHVMAAIDVGNYPEVRSWLEQGRKLLRQE